MWKASSLFASVSEQLSQSIINFRRFGKTIIASLSWHIIAPQFSFNKSQTADVGLMWRRFSGAAGQCRYCSSYHPWPNLWPRWSPPTPTSSPCRRTAWRSGPRSTAPSSRASIFPNWDFCQQRQGLLWSDHETTSIVKHLSSCCSNSNIPRPISPFLAFLSVVLIRIRVHLSEWHFLHNDQAWSQARPRGGHGAHVQVHWPDQAEPRVQNSLEQAGGWTMKDERKKYIYLYFWIL